MTTSLWLRLWLLACAVASPCSAAYRLGLCPTPVPGADPDAPRQWALEAGCTMPRLTIRADLWRLPGGRMQPDRALRTDVEAGAEPLVELTPGAPVLPSDESGAVRRPLPAGLFEPVAAEGGDTVRPEGEINPANTWARFVADVVERYDGDGEADAPGSPVVLWFTVAAPRGGLSRAESLTTGELARLAWVAAAAAGAAAAEVKVGFRPASPEELDAVLRDAPTHDGVHRLCRLRGTGRLRQRLRAVSHDGRQHGLAVPGVLSDAGATPISCVAAWGLPARPGRTAGCSGPRRRKSQLIGAVYDLATVQWAAVCDPSPGLVGLLGDVRLLRGDPRPPPARDGWYAFRTMATLMGDELAAGRAGFHEELAVGDQARCYRFDLDGQELLVAWALDFAGDADRAAEVRLPLRREVRYGRYLWDYCLTGRADTTVTGGRDGLVTTLGIDPEYFLAGAERTASPVRRKPAPEPPVWSITASSETAASPALLAVDGDPTTAWESPAGGAWWTAHWPAAPVTLSELVVTMSPRSGTVTVEASDDGVVWRAVAEPFVASGYAPHGVRLKRRVSSRWWRLVCSVGDEPVRLHEVSFGDGPGMPGR